MQSRNVVIPILCQKRSVNITDLLKGQRHSEISNVFKSYSFIELILFELIDFLISE